MNIAIIGYGHVGKAMHKLFQNAVVFDPALGMGNKDEVNKCKAAFVCVPTPMLENGRCDTKITEEVIEWLDVELIILRSTVEIGFTDAMAKKYMKKIVFHPEYYGETVDHPFKDLNGRKWLTFGGCQFAIDGAIKVYQEVINSDVKIFQTDAKSAELAKYMENSFLAMKVTFCNEMYDIADKLGVNYNKARELWLADPRIGASHTFVYEENRGYGGKCLPKDIASVISQAETAGANVSLLKATEERNKAFREA